MQQDVIISLEPQKNRPRKNGKYFQTQHTVPDFRINFVKMENNEAVYRIKLKSDDKIAARRLKREAKQAGAPLRQFVRDILTGEDPSTAWLYELAQDWAERKGMVIAAAQAD